VYRSSSDVSYGIMLSPDGLQALIKIHESDDEDIGVLFLTEGSSGLLVENRSISDYKYSLKTIEE